MLKFVTVASPTYVEKFGCPESLEDLTKHCAVGFRRITTGALRPFEFVDGRSERQLALDGRLSVTGAESYRQAVLLGLGLAQLPEFFVARDLDEGALVQVLANYPVPARPVSVLYARNRQLSPRVRMFIEWVVLQFAKDASH